jgi:cell division transport system permease protein
MAKKPGSFRITSSSTTVVVSLALVLFMLGLAGWAMLNFRNLTNSLKEEFGFQVIISEKATEANIQALRKELDASLFVKEAEYIPKEVAAEEMKKELGEDFVEFLGDNPLEPSINVKLNSTFVNNDSLEWIKSEIQSMAGGKTVKEINYHKLLFEEMDRNSRDIGLILIVLSALLSVVAIGLINNTIRLSIYSKRYLLRTMYLVGATQAFIRRPFIIKAIRQGVVSGILACLLIGGFIFVLVKIFPVLLFNQNQNQLLILMLSIILMGVLISSFSAALAIKRYLNLKAEELHL